MRPFAFDNTQVPGTFTGTFKPYQAPLQEWLVPDSTA